MARNSRQKDELKQLAQDAKARLSKGYWDKVKEQRADALGQAQAQGKDGQNVMRYFQDRCNREIAAMRNPIDRKEEEMYCKVKNILDHGSEVSNPITLLADEETMAGMSDNERQRYLFSLTHKYAALTKRYEYERKLLDGVHLSDE